MPPAYKGYAAPELTPAAPPIKIAYFITNSDLGGAQVHVWQISSHLPRPYEAVVIAGGQDRLFDKLSQSGVRAIALPALANSFSLGQTWQACRQLWQVLRAERPALIHAHSAKAGAMARLLGTLLGIPVVYTVHGFGFKPVVPWLKRQALFLIEWCLAPFTRKMICVAQSEAGMARRLPIRTQRVQVIHNGMPDVEARCAVQHSPCRVVMVARFAAPKRQDLLLQAFAELSHRAETLTMVGYGQQLESLKQDFASDKIHFVGEIDDIPTLLAQHQIFVLASDHEGLPLSIIEAMRAGMAIIATDLPGIRELITHNVHGVLVPAGDVAALRTALLRLYDDSALRQQLGQAARQRYAAEFGLAGMMQKLVQVYQEILPIEQGAPACAKKF